MRQFPSFVVVIRLLVLLTIATITVSLDQADFSARLEQVVDNVLGAKQFEVIAIAFVVRVNPLMGTLKPQSNGPLYRNTVIGTLAVDGWAVTFGTATRGLSAGRAGGPAQSPYRCICNSPPITASVLTLCYSM